MNITSRIVRGFPQTAFVKSAKTFVRSLFKGHKPMNVTNASEYFLKMPTGNAARKFDDEHNQKNAQDPQHSAGQNVDRNWLCSTFSSFGITGEAQQPHAKNQLYMSEVRLEENKVSSDVQRSNQQTKKLKPVQGPKVPNNYISSLQMRQAPLPPRQPHRQAPPPPRQPHRQAPPPPMLSHLCQAPPLAE